MQRAAACLIAALCLCPAPCAAAERLRLATTTSTDNSGLLAVLNPPFERRFDVRVDVIAVGTGKALRLAQNGDVDLVMVHSPEAERDFVARGFGVRRWPLMHNRFVILGPAADPADIGTSDAAHQALQRIHAGRALFVSRADNSGTHRKEQQLWQQAGIEPRGPWYLAIGQGMAATLQIADERLAYTLCDQATWLRRRAWLRLAALFQGDPALHNPYHLIVVNPGRHPHVRHQLAQRYVEYARGPQGQAIVRGYRIDGQPLFMPDVLK